MVSFRVALLSRARLAGDIDQSQWSVKNQEHSCITTVTSTLATGTDGQPQLKSNEL